MDHAAYDDAYLTRVLTEARVIAMVGASDNPGRASHQVMRFLQGLGRRVLPVNPTRAGAEILGEPVVASLSDLPEDAGVDMVDIFRRSEAAGAVVDEAIAALAPRGLKSVWMQLGVRDAAAAARAERAGLAVVMDRCPAIEAPRLGVL